MTLYTIKDTPLQQTTSLRCLIYFQGNMHVMLASPVEAFWSRDVWENLALAWNVLLWHVTVVGIFVINIAVDRQFSSSWAASEVELN